MNCAGKGLRKAIGSCQFIKASHDTAASDVLVDY